MNKKTYNIEHWSSGAELTVEIDHDFVSKKIDPKEKWPVDRIIKEMVDFWTGSEDKLKANNGDYLNTFLKQLCRHVATILAYKNLNTEGIIDEFDNEEGWFKMDGTYGIKILDVCEPDFDNDNEYNIRELK